MWRFLIVAFCLLTPVFSAAAADSLDEAAPAGQPDSAALLKDKKLDRPVLKRPGRMKRDSTRLKRGQVTPERIMRWRRSLRPLLKKPDMRRMPRKDVLFVEELNRKARVLDRRLERWLRVARKYERINALRDAAAKSGRNTKELDIQLARLERARETARGDAELANVDMQKLLNKQQDAKNLVSRLAKWRHDLAMAISRKIGG